MLRSDPHLPSATRGRPVDAERGVWCADLRMRVEELVQLVQPILRSCSGIDAAAGQTGHKKRGLAARSAHAAPQRRPAHRLSSRQRQRRSAPRRGGTTSRSRRLQAKIAALWAGSGGWLAGYATTPGLAPPARARGCGRTD